jgi:hypothetical protein
VAGLIEIATVLALFFGGAGGVFAATTMTGPVTKGRKAFLALSCLCMAVGGGGTLADVSGHSDLITTHPLQAAGVMLGATILLTGWSWYVIGSPLRRPTWLEWIVTRTPIEFRSPIVLRQLTPKELAPLGVLDFEAAFVAEGGRLSRAMDRFVRPMTATGNLMTEGLWPNCADRGQFDHGRNAVARRPARAVITLSEFGYRP